MKKVILIIVGILFGINAVAAAVFLTGSSPDSSNRNSQDSPTKPTSNISGYFSWFGQEKNYKIVKAKQSLKISSLLTPITASVEPINEAEEGEQEKQVDGVTESEPEIVSDKEELSEAALKTEIATNEPTKVEETISEPIGGPEPDDIIEFVPEPVEPEPIVEPEPKEYEVHPYVATGLFWVGETGSHANGFDEHKSSAWLKNWIKSYGGIDDPGNRCGWLPCKFIPKENPFYVSLPYNDLDAEGNRKASAQSIPWFDDASEQYSVVKNRWVKLSYQGKFCYAQWEDAGPKMSDDFDYVFGQARPQNNFGNHEGLGISPATRDCLGLRLNDPVTWQFVEAGDVPSGPWTQIITQ